MLATNGTKEEKEDKQTKLDMIFKGELGQWQKRKETLTLNAAEAYTLIISTYCSKVIQQRVEELPDYDTKIRGDPIELL